MNKINETYFSTPFENTYVCLYYSILHLGKYMKTKTKKKKIVILFIIQNVSFARANRLINFYLLT